MYKWGDYMDMQLTFEKELFKLKEDEDNIELFREMFLKDIDSTDKYKSRIDKLLKFVRENNLMRSKAWAYYYLGCYNFYISQFETAVDNFFASYNLFLKLNNKYEMAYTCNGLTSVYCRMGQFKLASEWGLKGISFCEETGNKEVLTKLFINTGINYIQMGYYDKAKEIFECVESMERMGQELTWRQRMACMLSLAEIEINIGNPQKAIEIIDGVLRLETANHTNRDICNICKLKGMAYLKIGNYLEAEREFESSYNSTMEKSLIYEKCATMLEWSKLYFLTEEYHKAISFLSEIISIGSLNRFKIIIRESYYLLYKIYKEQNIADLALDYLEKYIKADDEMYDYEQNQLMAKMNLENTKRIAEQYKQLYNRTELLSLIGQKILSNLDLDSIIHIINDEINKLIDADYFGVALYDHINNQSTYYLMKDNLMISEIVEYSGESTFGEYCIKNKKDIIIGNEDKEYKKYLNECPKRIIGFGEKKCSISSIIYTPMIINDKVVGLMTVQSEKENRYNKDDLHILKILANYTAIAVENAISYKKIEDIAINDNLTKFFTKLEILKVGDVIYEKYKKANNKFSVIMMDIDNFKEVNDAYGHIYGDKALSLVARSVSKCIRSTDYIGRFGGDEFLLICPDAGTNEARDVAERIRGTVENNKYVLDDGVEVTLTLSLGVHECDENDKSFTDVLNKADQCLYKAKKMERNKVVCNEFFT